MVKSCPKCNSGLADDAIICPNCGTHLNSAPSPLIIDSDELNNEQMNAFNSGNPIEFSAGGLSEDAQKDMAEMDNLPIDELLNEMGVAIEPDPESEPAPALVLQPTPVRVVSPPIPQAYEETENEPAETAPPLKNKKEPKIRRPKADKTNKINKKSNTAVVSDKPADTPEQKTEEFESSDGGVIFNPEIHDHDDIVVKEGVSELKRFELSSKAKKTIFRVAVMICMFCTGFGISYLLTQDMLPNAVNDTAYDSVVAIQAKTPDDKKFIAYDVYVKRDVHTTECIIFGILSSEVNSSVSTHYRVLINNQDRSDTTIFRPFDQDEYDALKKGTEEEYMKASHMMSFHENFLRSVNEINSGNERWVRADIAFIINKLSI